MQQDQNQLKVQGWWWKDINRWDLPYTYKFTRNQLENPCDSVLLHLYLEVVEVCLFSENTKEWINCYKDGDVSSSVVFNSGFSWVESLSYDRNEWVELHKQMGAAKAQIILRDFCEMFLFPKCQCLLSGAVYDYVTKAVDHSKTVVTYSDFINKDSMAQSLVWEVWCMALIET